MRTFVLSFLLILSTASFAQNDTIAYEAYGTDSHGRLLWFDPVEHHPRFDGDINSWLMANLKYPPTAAESNIEGRVIVQFMVKADGTITDAKVRRGVAPELDAEALRVVNSMPKWIPANKDGKDIDCKFTLPVPFKLQ